MKHRIVNAWTRLLLRRPGTVALVLLALAAVSVVGAQRLTLNTNQLDLISQDLRQVKDVKRVVDMVGGAGHLILTLRGGDEKKLKAAADDLAAMLLADKEHVREITYKVNTEFLRKNAALFMETDDLKEVRKRVDLKLKDAIKRASPFYVEIRHTDPYELKLDDIIEKYKHVGKKSIADDYYISDDHQMVLILIKPMWDSNQLAQTGELVDSIRQRIADYSKGNAAGVKLVEDYSGTPNADASTIGFGFTGTYQTNYDDSYQIKNSLAPVSVISFIGVLICLLLFFGRHISSILLIVSGLALGIILTFGFTWLAVGQLNMITAILAGILMGIGIDFGIHFTYRLRLELGLGQDLETAIAQTVLNSGPASLASAMGTGAAFLSLLFSEFRGFSQFGLLAGVGVFLIGATMYLWVPSLLLLIERWRPGLAVRLIGRRAASAEGAGGTTARLPAPWALLLVSGAAAVGVAIFAPGVRFEYNTRALMVEDQPSVRLQDEVNRRFQISSDPVAIYTPTIEEAKKVYDLFTPLDRTKFSTVDQVVSMYSFVPPAERQQANAQVLKAWREDLARIDRKSLPADLEEKWDEGMSYVNVEPYGLDHVPTFLREMFTNLPTAKAENHGFLTFVYPVVDLWDGKQMLKFADEVETLKTADGGEYHAAGLPILFAKLARIVLFDARLTVALTGVLLVLILLVDFRSLRNTLAALIPLIVGMGVMLGVMALGGFQLNFMNVVVFPIVLGYGISHGVYLMHRFNEGVSPLEALRSVGAAVACSTLTTLAGWAALLWAAHRGLKSMGLVACIGMAATLVVSFTVMLALLQLLHDRRTRRAPEEVRRAA
jgi:predicted RND superfamily exporter protein